MTLTFEDKRAFALKETKRGQLVIGIAHNNAQRLFTRVTVKEADGKLVEHLIELTDLGTQYPDLFDLNSPVRPIEKGEFITLTY